jgi:hypothetical protein
MIDEFSLATPALLRLATIVRAADTGRSVHGLAWRQLEIACDRTLSA